MKLCSHCGESNADDRNDCWKCGQPLVISSNSKFCMDCHESCITQSNICPMCGGKLVGASERGKEEKPDNTPFLIIIAILIPIIGFIIGLIKVAKSEKNGAFILAVSIFASFVFYVIYLLLVSMHLI